MSTANYRDPGVSRLTHLDFARGMAALAVCAEHLRAFQFVEYGKMAAPPSLIDKLFYLVTGFGHQAVMIFFVLSGYFVGGSVLRDGANGRWSWLKFASRRLNRLYMVLIPALLLTLLWDSLGRQSAFPGGYSGDFLDLYHSGPGPGNTAQDGIAAFLGNSLFLQTITGPVYGSNGPLWSLAYEFWYYLMFPLALLAISPSGSWLYRGVHGALLAGCLTFLPRDLLVGGLVWLMGCAIAWASRHAEFNARLSGKPAFFTWTMIILAALLLSRKVEVPGIDLLLGISFAGMLPFLIKSRPVSRLYAFASTGLSDISYTLYLTHFPLLAFFFFTFRPGSQMNPSPVAYGEFALFLGAVLVYATVIWWLFERRTDAVRKVLERVLRVTPNPVRAASGLTNT